MRDRPPVAREISTTIGALPDETDRFVGYDLRHPGSAGRATVRRFWRDRRWVKAAGAHTKELV